VDEELALGEGVDVLDEATGEVAFSIVADAVVPDIACTADAATAAVNGHLVGLHLRVRTGPAPAAGAEAPQISAEDFGFVGANAVPATDVSTGSAAACLGNDESFPSKHMDPQQDAAGTIVLDVPDSTGTITYGPEGRAVSLRWRF
jgi:hypothetical protein